MILHGGKTVYGASLGILMLNTRFPRIPGDIGNASTWPFPVQYRIVPEATPEKVVRGDAASLLDSFIAAGRELVEMGCDGIATNCGFLVPLQDNLSAALGVPVASSSLLQVPMVQRTPPDGERVGILTISSRTLTARYLEAAGVPADTPVVGTGDGSEFTEKIVTDADRMDFAQARQDNIAAASRLVSEHPGIGAIVLECTNMVPYAADIRKATGKPVYSIYSYLLWFQAALAPRRFATELDDPRP